MRRFSYFALAFVQLACREKEPLVQTDAQVSRSGVGSAQAKRGPCERVRGAQLREVKEGCATPAPRTVRASAGDTDLSAFSNCIETSDGAWGLALTRCVPEAEVEARAFGMTGTLHAPFRAVYAASDAGLVEGAQVDDAEVGNVAGFDIDHDGVTELLVSGRAAPSVQRSEAFQTMRRSVGAIMTVRGGSVVAFPAVPAFERIVDADQDGQPDLITRLADPLTGSDGDVTSWQFMAPEGLAHGLPDGRFTTTDSVAVAWVRKACDAVGSIEHASVEAIYAAAICARVAGIGASEIAARYASRCTALTAERQAKGPPPRAACRVEDMGEWKRGTPKELAATLARIEPAPATRLAAPSTR